MEDTNSGPALQAHRHSEWEHDRSLDQAQLRLLNAALAMTELRNSEDGEDHERKIQLVKLALYFESLGRNLQMDEDGSFWELIGVRIGSE